MCPAEILMLIFELLSPTEYYALCLVNRWMRATVEPLLYSELRCIWREAHYPPPIIPFLQTVSRRPDLASCVRRIHLDGHHFPLGYRQDQIPIIPVSGIQLDELSVVIRRTRAPYRELWIRELSRGNPNAVIALLLEQLSNLRSFYMGPAFSQLNGLMGQALHSRLCANTTLNCENLQDVSILFGEHESRDSWFQRFKDIPDVLHFFYLPKIQNLTISIVNPGAWAWPKTVLPNPSTLKSLDLTCIREAHLAEVLSVSGNIEKLRWTILYYQDLDRPGFADFEINDLNGIADALRHVRDTLTDLKISASINPKDQISFFPDIIRTGTLRALVEMEKIKRLEIPWIFLLGLEEDWSRRLQHSIPRNVQFVTLTDDLRYLRWDQWGWDVEAVMTLLESWLGD